MLSSSNLTLRTQRLGPLPVINHFVDRMGLDELLAEFVPTTDRRQQVSHAKALGVLVRSLLVEREAIYRQQEMVSSFAPEAFGVDRDEAAHLGDDVAGRALDRLFDADRGTLLTRVVVAAVKRLDVAMDELHNDSTSIKFTGEYSEATGRSLRGKRAAFITYGHSKDHRPDLKQLLFILTTSSDGGIPVQFRCEGGNTSDSVTHEETWDTLCQVTGRPDFLYVADCKLCERIAKAEELLGELQAQLTGPRARRRSYKKVDRRVDEILASQQVGRWICVKILGTETHRYRHVTAGRPGPATRYLRTTKRGWRLEWLVDEKLIAYDHKSDGMYPLITNDRNISVADAFAAHRRQPAIEKRFEQLKSVFELAPLFLKNEGRIEALFLLSFLALLVQALLERELRRGMKRSGLAHIPLYPEERACHAPTSEQILRLFSLPVRTTLDEDDSQVRVFDPELSDLQRLVLQLIGAPASAYLSRQ